VSATSHQASVAPTQQNVATESANSTTENDLIGTWVSTTKDKGMQGAGKIVLPKSTTQFAISSDVTLVITGVENNIGSGTVSYTNLCTPKPQPIPQERLLLLKSFLAKAPPANRLKCILMAIK